MRKLLVTALAAAAIVPVGLVAPAADAGRMHLPSGSCGGRMMTSQLVDGVRLRCMPPQLGVGEDFDSEDGDAHIVSRFWETPRPDGWGVDAVVSVVRHPGLTTPVRAANWMIAWQDRPSSEARYRRIDLGGGVPAWITTDEIIWLHASGVVVSVRIDPTRYQADLRGIARSAQQ